MKIYKGIAGTDGENRNNICVPFMALLNAYDEYPLSGIPSNLGHDSTKPIGWTYIDGIYIEPGKSYIINSLNMADSPEDQKWLRYKIGARYQDFLNNNNDDIERLRFLLEDKLSKDAEVVPTNGIAFHDNSILYRVFPQFKPDDPKDTKALTPLKVLPECAQFIPGIFRIGDFLIYAHTYFRRGFSVVNSLNDEFLSKLVSLRNKEGVDVGIKLDPDLIGLAGTENSELEFQYMWGPKFDKDLTRIPHGVTRHDNSEFDRLFTGIDRTEFGWYVQDGNKTLECEEISDEQENIVANDEKLFGCRYIHSFLNSATGLPTHLDGAVRAYTADQISERIDTPIDHVGRNTRYTKLWRIDGDLPVETWKELITSYFRDNRLVGEYLGGEDEKLEQYINEDNTPDAKDPIEAYIPIALNREDGIRFFYSRWEKDDSILFKNQKMPSGENGDDHDTFKSYNSEPDVVIKSYETLKYGDRKFSIIESETVSIAKELARKGLKYYCADKSIRVAHEDLILNFPLFECRTYDTARSVIETFFDFCRFWKEQGDDRKISFSICVPYRDDVIHVSFAGHVDDLVDVFTKMDALFADSAKDLHKWLQRLYNINNHYRSADNHPRATEFVTNSKELYIKRTQVPWDIITSVNKSGTITVMMNRDDLEFLNRNGIIARPVYIVCRSVCSKCGRDFTQCECSKLDDGVTEIMKDYGLLEYCWAD